MSALDAGMMAKAVQAKLDLQAIYDNPKPGWEAALKREVLMGMSEPHHWDETTALCVLFAVQQFKKGFMAAANLTVEVMALRPTIPPDFAQETGYRAGYGAAQLDTSRLLKRRIEQP